MSIYSRPASSLSGLTSGGVTAQAIRDRQLEVQLEELEARLASLEATASPVTAATATTTLAHATSSTSYVLSTPSLTFTVGPSGKVLVIVSAQLYNSSTSGGSYMSWAGGGFAAHDLRALIMEAEITEHAASHASLVSMPAGTSVTLDAAYRSVSASYTAYADERHLTVITF